MTLSPASPTNPRFYPAFPVQWSYQTGAYAMGRLLPTERLRHVIRERTPYLIHLP